MILDDQKTRISSWGHEGPNAHHECKFGVRAVSKVDINNVQTEVHMDWIGVGFGQRLVEGKNWRNFLFGQDVNGEVFVAVRGQNQPLTKLDWTVNPFSMYQELVDGRNCSWTVTRVNEHLATMRSSCCPFAFNWRPDGVDTCFELFVGDETGLFQDGTMIGLCGDCNNDIVDDIRSCPDDVHGAIGFLPEISDSCSSGKHQGNGFPGGNRL